MNTNLDAHPVTRQLIHALHHEGFASSLDVDKDDEYVTLTIQRNDQ